MTRKAKAKARANNPRKAPSLATAKSLRTLFESAAVRQKAHDASLELQKRIRDHNAAIQERMETHRLRDMTRGDTPQTARVGRTMLGARPRSRTPPRPRVPRAAPPPPPPTRTVTRPRSRTPTRIIRRPRTPPGPIPRFLAPGQVSRPPPPAPSPTGTRIRRPARYDIGRN
jgi:hypothetical protein